MLHKDFRDFVLDVFLEIVLVCVVRLKTTILICANIRKSMCAADVYIKRILFANVGIMQNYRLEKRSKGKNNYIFVIKNLTDGLGYPTNELSIYDRWGKRVYHRENITSEEDFWDPGAENVPAGTYFYRFVGKGYLGNIQRNGVVEVLR